MNVKKLILLFLLMFDSFTMIAQQEERKIEAAVFEGTVVAGYVDQGAYLNFLGPSISFKKGNHKLILGMLPSLRFKEDKGTTKNFPVTPNLGGGITYIYKKSHFSFRCITM
jgi:hypothetical protein